MTHLQCTTAQQVVSVIEQEDKVMTKSGAEESQHDLAQFTVFRITFYSFGPSCNHEYTSALSYRKNLVYEQ